MGEEVRKRATAIRLRISEVRALPFVREGGMAPSYLQAGERISRLCLVGTVVQKADDNLSLVLDDGSETIALRVFEDRGLLSVGIGDIVLVIGKPREFGSERYVLPEAVRKVDAGWLRVHLGELSKRGMMSAPASPGQPATGAGNGGKKEARNDAADPEAEPLRDSPGQKICAFIRQHDAGNGVDVQDIIEAGVAEGCEALVSSLLRSGDIFEVGSGRVKVLE